MHPDDIVRLATASNPQEAYLWRQVLEDEGIQCRVVGDYLDAGLGDVPGIRPEVWVHQNDVDRARAILEPHMSAPPEMQETATEEEDEPSET